ncbi:MAG: SRPBCC family protein [Phycisphaerae bacterium]|nr:SRPBCC family protein [Phycisphaerae bacterium]
MSIVWFIGGLLATIIGVACMGGALLPRDHVATGSVVVPRSPADAYRHVRDFARLPSWRPSVSKVEIAEGPADAPTRWTEHAKGGPLRLHMVRETPDASIEIRIDDKGQPFGGTWTIEFSPEGQGARIRVTERGFVKLPPFRLVAKFVIGHRAALVAYLKDLSGALGGPTTVDE